MYRKRKNDWHADLRQLHRVFRDVARFDGPYSRAANVNAFNLFHAKAAYSVDFDVHVGRALLTRFDASRRFAQ